MLFERREDKKDYNYINNETGTYKLVNVIYFSQIDLYLNFWILISIFLQQMVTCGIIRHA